MSTEPVSEQFITNSKGRSRRVLLSVVGVLAVAGLGVWYVLHVLDQKGKHEVNVAWGELSQCLLGAPLKDGEKASARYRNIELTYMGMSAAQKSADGQEPWPGRCVPIAHNVRQVLHLNGRETETGNDLASMTEKLTKALQDNKPIAEPIDAAWAQAQKDEVVAEPNAQAAPPPAPANPLLLDDLDKAAGISKTPFSVKSVTTEPNNGPDLNLLVEDKSIPTSPMLCTLTAQATSLKCKKLTGDVASKSGLRLAGSTEPGAAPLIFAGAGDGVYRSDTGERVTDMPIESAYSAKNGYVALASTSDYDAGKFTLLQQTGPGAPVTSTVVSAADLKQKKLKLHRYKILWDNLFMQMLPDDGSSPHTFAAHLPASDPNNQFEDIGEANHVNSSFSGCRGSQGTVMRFGTDFGFLSFNTGKAWTKPVRVEEFSGSFSCHKSVATFTSVDMIHQATCTPAGCQQESVDSYKFMHSTDYLGARDLAPRENFLDGGDLDGKVLVVWGAGESGGIRMRLAAVEQLAAARDTVIYDDMVHAGKRETLSTAIGMKVYTREGFALVLLDTPAGVHTIRISPTGEFALLKVEN